MLIGEYQHSLDAKGRVIIPAKFREELGVRFIMTKGFDGCLYAYSRAFERWFFGGAVECEVDRQGRVIIPQNLRDHAGLVKDAVILGNRSKVEIWSREAWEKYAEENHSCEAFAETMAGLRI